MTITTNLYIDGNARTASDNGTYEVKNPLTGKVVGLAAAATSQDCKMAADAAGKAFHLWEKTPIFQRRDIILKAAEVIQTEKHRTEILKCVVEETASPATFSLGQLASASGYLRSLAAMAHEIRGMDFPSSSIPGIEIIVQRRAIGGILAIIPWNAPILLTLRGICIPLLCGNTVVVKASEISPRSIFLMVDIFREAGLPDGVLNFVSMSPKDAPNLVAELIAHPAIKKVNFTGSDRVGRIIAMEAAKHLKPCVLELGGKAPAIVLEDADIAQAAKAIVSGAMLFSGQICMSTERVIVQRSVADTLISNILQHSKTLQAGDESKPLGSLFSEGSAENVLNLILEAQKAGAEVLLGDLKRNASVIQPHILRGVTPEMRLWQRESFGPVLVVAVVESIQEAVELANSTDYSLASSLWTNNVHTMREVAPMIRAGVVNVNGSTFFSDPYLGVVGLTGSSGYGRFEVDEFTIKRLIVNHPIGVAYPLIKN